MQGHAHGLRWIWNGPSDWSDGLDLTRSDVFGHWIETNDQKGEGTWLVRVLTRIGLGGYINRGSPLFLSFFSYPFSVSLPFLPLYNPLPSLLHASSSLTRRVEVRGLLALWPAISCGGGAAAGNLIYSIFFCCFLLLFFSSILLPNKNLKKTLYSSRSKFQKNNTYIPLGLFFDLTLMFVLWNGSGSVLLVLCPVCSRCHLIPSYVRVFVLVCGNWFVMLESMAADVSDVKVSGCWLGSWLFQWQWVTILILCCWFGSGKMGWG